MARKRGRPSLGDAAMSELIGVRLSKHDLARLTSYAAVKGYKGPGVALRALGLKSLDGIRRKTKRTLKGLSGEKSYFTV